MRWIKLAADLEASPVILWSYSLVSQAIAVCISDWHGTGQQVIGSAQEESRLLMCKAVAIVMRQCLELLGITPLERL